MQRVAAGVPSANSRQTRIRIEEGVESPEGQVKTSLSLSLSRHSSGSAVLCKYMCVLLLSLPLRTKGCARCLLNEYYQSSEGGCCRRSVAGEDVHEAGEFRGRGIPRDCLGESTHLTGGTIRCPDWRAFQKTAGNRNEQFRKEESNMSVINHWPEEEFASSFLKQLLLKFFSILSRC